MATPASLDTTMKEEFAGEVMSNLHRSGSIRGCHSHDAVTLNIYLSTEMNVLGRPHGGLHHYHGVTRARYIAFDEVNATLGFNTEQPFLSNTCLATNMDTA
jgi:hypothetical protein